MKKIIYGALLAFGMYGGCEGMMETDLSKNVAMENDCEKDLSVLSSYPFLAGCKENEEIGKINWQEVADNTELLKDLSWCSPMALAALQGNSNIDWHVMLEDAVNGDPVAQYCMAEKYELDSKLSYGKYKKSLQVAMSLLVFISAQKGRYEPAKLAICECIHNLPELNFSNSETISEAVKLFIGED